MCKVYADFRNCERTGRARDTYNTRARFCLPRLNLEPSDRAPSFRGFTARLLRHDQLRTARRVCIQLPDEKAPSPRPKHDRVQRVRGRAPDAPASKYRARFAAARTAMPFESRVTRGHRARKVRPRTTARVMRGGGSALRMRDMYAHLSAVKTDRVDYKPALTSISPVQVWVP